MWAFYGRTLLTILAGDQSDGHARPVVVDRDEIGPSRTLRYVRSSVDAAHLPDVLAVAEAGPPVPEFGVVVGQEAGVRVLAILQVADRVLGEVFAVHCSVY